MFAHPSTSIQPGFSAVDSKINLSVPNSQIKKQNKSQALAHL
jgi:hypothetical protein